VRFLVYIRIYVYSYTHIYIYMHIQGPSGQQGPAGVPAVGPQGEPGDTGEAGDAGQSGAAGEDNHVEGKKGEAGKDGVVGAPGVVGASGVDAPDPTCNDIPSTPTKCKHGGVLLEYPQCACDCSNAKGFSGLICNDCNFDGESGRVVVGICRRNVHAKGTSGDGSGQSGAERYARTHVEKAVGGAVKFSILRRLLKRKTEHQNQTLRTVVVAARKKQRVKTARIADRLKGLIRKLKPQLGKAG